MAMLLGGARLLKEREQELRGAGTVKLVFQPAEEGGAGAARMLSEGTCDTPEATTADRCRCAAGYKARLMPTPSCGVAADVQCVNAHRLDWARAMPAGALDGVDAAFGLHVMPSVPTGHIAGAAHRLLCGRPMPPGIPLASRFSIAMSRHLTQLVL